jgi:hypothetical protein
LGEAKTKREGGKNLILAIDPGTFESAYVIMGEGLKPIEFGKVENKKLLKLIQNIKDKPYQVDHLAMEMVASYGMAVGKDVFETCVWIGKFIQTANGKIPNIKRIYRKEVKMNLCHTMKANDSNIRQALVDRFAYGVSNYGKGKKDSPGWFYGFAADVWQAYAVGVTYYDTYISNS